MKLKNIQTGIVWEFSLPEDKKIAQQHINSSKFELVEISKEEKEFIEVPAVPKHLSIEDRLTVKPEETERQRLFRLLKEKNIEFSTRAKNVELEKLLDESR